MNIEKYELYEFYKKDIIYLMKNKKNERRINLKRVIAFVKYKNNLTDKQESKLIYICKAIFKNFNFLKLGTMYKGSKRLLNEFVEFVEREYKPYNLLNAELIDTINYIFNNHKVKIVQLAKILNVPIENIKRVKNRLDRFETYKFKPKQFDFYYYTKFLRSIKKKDDLDITKEKEKELYNFYIEKNFSKCSEIIIKYKITKDDLIKILEFYHDTNCYFDNIINKAYKYDQNKLIRDLFKESKYKFIKKYQIKTNYLFLKLFYIREMLILNEVDLLRAKKIVENYPFLKLEFELLEIKKNYKNLAEKYDVGYNQLYNYMNKNFGGLKKIKDYYIKLLTKRSENNG